MNPDLESKINSEIPSPNSASVGEKQLLHWLIREMKPRTIVETGTHRGLATLYMAEAVRQNGFGHITTYDPNDWGQPGNFRKFPELSPLITYKADKGIDMAEKNIDFAFIDGFHGFKDVYDEIKVLLPRLSEQAVVVFHDCWYEEAGVKNGCDVNGAVEAAGLETIWLPTTNAIRIYSKHPEKMNWPSWKPKQ